MKQPRISCDSNSSRPGFFLICFCSTTVHLIGPVANLLGLLIH